MEPAVVASLIKGIVVVGVLITLIIFLIIKLRDYFQNKRYIAAMQQRQAEHAAWLAAQPPYTPKGGLLGIGVKLSIDYDNPQNQGKSGLASKTWVSDVVHSAATGKDLYVISYEFPSFDSNDPNKMTIRSTTPMTSDEVFQMWKIIEE